MSHAITNTNGFNEMAFVGEKPWHGLGQELQPGADIETWCKAAGMDWRVQRAKVRFLIERIEDGAMIDPKALQTWDERHVLLRSDTKKPLGLVSDGYKVVQPREVLQFFDEVAHINGLQLETAGTLNGGKRYWALAKTGAHFALGGIDGIDGYVMLATSADGSMATEAKFTSVRIVCANTLAMARADGKQAIRVKHSTTFNADQVRMDLGLAEETWDEFTQNATRLATRKLSRSEATGILIASMGDADKFMVDLQKMPRKEAIEAQPNVRVMAQIMDIFQGKLIGSSSMTEDTAWGLVNAATQYFDHDAGRSQDTRLTSSWFGPNASRKQEILKAALELCE